MKFPDVTLMTTATVDGAGEFYVFMVAKDWMPDDDSHHDRDHARGGCECPCYPPDPVQQLLDGAERGKRP